MTMTTAQLTTLGTALRAEPTQSVIDAVAIGNATYLAEWCNGASTQAAWIEDMSALALFEASDMTLFDALTAGKRDAWRMMLDFAPISAKKNANRKAIVDVWSNTNSVPILQACTRMATRGEKYLGGDPATTNTVTAWKLNWTGFVTIDDVGQALILTRP